MIISPEIIVLCITAASIAFVHTLLGPDHYLPFVAMAKANKWSRSKTARVVLLCGFGHIVGSIGLGIFGVLVGTELGLLEWVEAWRGDLAAWGLIIFGVLYMSWGLRKGYLNKPHSHLHAHADGVVHSHDHKHSSDHAHAHVEANLDKDTDSKTKNVIAPWGIFIIFVLGPCEPLIPLLMYPAATLNMASVVAVAAIFGIVTMLTMLMAVMISTWGLQFIKIPKLERFSHAIMGSTILMCGVSITAFGL